MSSYLMQNEFASYAKINLALQVVSKRADGYHNLRTIFHKISLHDTIVITPLEDDKIELSTDSSLLPSGSDNIAFKAALRFKKKYRIKKGVKIDIKKQIPISAGLGGGSSNAATVLAALNEIWSLGVPQDELSELGATLGADVPFFLHDATSCFGLHKGDFLAPLDIETSNHFLLLLVPPFGVSTTEVYKNFPLDKLQEQTTGQKQREAALKVLFYLEEVYIKQGLSSFRIGLEEIAFVNDLESVSFSLYPALQDLKNKILDTGAQNALMSGSGCTLFGIYNDMNVAEKALSLLQNEPGTRLFMFPFG